MGLEVQIRKELKHFCLRAEFHASGEIFSVLGESGCGKSMTLKCIAGIETPDAGRIVLDGRVLYDSVRGINLPPQKRRVGYLFQNYALFPNMTVRQNIGIGVPREMRREKTEEMIRQFFLEGLEEQYPAYLSGGQQQRAAFARMMAADPELILLDEPFSSIDSYLGWQIEKQLMDFLDKCHKTVLFVSHNRDEVYRLSDKIGVIHRGHMEITGTRHEIFRAPKTVAAALLTGCKNVTELEQISMTEGILKEWNLRVTLKEPVLNANITALGVRSHDIRLIDEQSVADHLADRGQGTVAACEIIRCIEAPFDLIYQIRPYGAAGELRTEMPKDPGRMYERGRQIWCYIPADKWMALE